MGRARYLRPADLETGDYFGQALAIDNDSIIIGSQYDDDQGTDAGAAYIYTRVDSVWSQQQKIYSSAPADGAKFGLSVDIYKDWVGVGAPFQDLAAGAVYVHTRTDSVWSDGVLMVPEDIASTDLFGSSLAFTDDSIIISSSGDDDVDSDAGAVYEFGFFDSVWLEQHKLTIANDVGLYGHLGRLDRLF